MHDNPVIFQTFEWNIPSDQKHYQRLIRALPGLHAIGITALWLPPACKAGNSTGNGYDIYDLYDLGEFDQRGSRSTKWGPYKDLEALVKKAKELDVDLYFDAVLNHRCGGDRKSVINAVESDPDDRRKDLCEPKEIEAWLNFDFAGRDGRYSTAKYDWRQFNASDWNDREKKRGIFRIVDGGKSWAKDVSEEWGNGDYLMFNNCDYTNKELRDDVDNWGVWATKHLGLSGFRLDAMQHFSHAFSMNWMRHVSQKIKKDMFFVGEYWSGDVKVLDAYLEKSSPDLHLYDAPLLYNFGRLSCSKTPDLRTVFERSLVYSRPKNAVTLVMNHDTQKGQVMDTPITPAFTSLAYALILLREAGYPCVFYGDMFGTSSPHSSSPTCGGKLADLVLARRLYAHGEQEDYFLSPDCIGWVRKGDAESGGHKAVGMAVVMSWVGDSPEPTSSQSPSNRPGWMRKLYGKFGLGHVSENQPRRKMNVGKEHAGEVWTDILGHSTTEVAIAHDGCGIFLCTRNTVSIYVSGRAEGKNRFPVYFQSDIYSS